MHIKKFAAFLAYSVLACCVCTAVPMGETVCAQASEDFITEYNGGSTYISGYTGNGGDIVIPADISGVEMFAFYQNENITGVTFEGDIESIGGLAFCGCKNLEKVVFMGDVISVNDDDGISYNAFMGCPKLKTVEFAEDARVDTVGRAAFMDCASLTDVRLPNHLEMIRENAFMNCPELTQLEIPQMTELEDFAVGYMFDEETEENVKADGVASVRADIDFDFENPNISEIIQKPITLIVTEGSYAEKYAEANEIAYKYISEAEDFDTSAAEENPYTGENSSLPKNAAAIAITAFILIVLNNCKITNHCVSNKK